MVCPKCKDLEKIENDYTKELCKSINELSKSIDDIKENIGAFCIDCPKKDKKGLTSREKNLRLIVKIGEGKELPDCPDCKKYKDTTNWILRNAWIKSLNEIHTRLKKQLKIMEKNCDGCPKKSEIFSTYYMPNTNVHKCFICGEEKKGAWLILPERKRVKGYEVIEGGKWLCRDCEKHYFINFDYPKIKKKKVEHEEVVVCDVCNKVMEKSKIEEHFSYMISKEKELAKESIDRYEKFLVKARKLLRMKMDKLKILKDRRSKAKTKVEISKLKESMKKAKKKLESLKRTRPSHEKKSWHKVDGIIFEYMGRRYLLSHGGINEIH